MRAVVSVIRVLPAGCLFFCWQMVMCLPGVGAADLGELEQQRRVLEEQLSLLPDVPALQFADPLGFHSGFARQVDDSRWVQVDLGRVWPVDAIVIIPAVGSRGDVHGFPLRFRLEVSQDADFAEATTVLEQVLSEGSVSPLPWVVPARRVSARYVRFTALQLSAQPGLTNRFIFCLGELLVFSGGRNVALKCGVYAPGSVTSPPTWAAEYLVDGFHALGLPVKPSEIRSNGWHSAVHRRPEVTQWVQLTWESPQVIDEIRLIPAHPHDYPDRPGFGFPLRFFVETDEGGVMDHRQRDFLPPGNRPVAIPCPGLRTRTVRVTATRLFERSQDFIFALAEVQAFHGGENVAPQAVVSSLESTLTPAWSLDFLVDGMGSSAVLRPELEWLSGLSERREMEEELKELEAGMEEARKVRQRRQGVFLVVSVVGGLVLGLTFYWSSQRRQRRMLEELRLQISRDLHDEIGSHLGSIRLTSEMALRQGAEGEALEEIQRLSREASDAMRGIIWLVREGGRPALSRLTEAMRQSAETLLKGVRWRFEGPAQGLPEVVANLLFHRHVFLIFREILHNVMQHSDASAVSIQVGWNARRLELEVSDDGRGFEPGQGLGGQGLGGQGLSNLRGRAQALGADLQIHSQPGHGTRVTLSAPIS